MCTIRSFTAMLIAAILTLTIGCKQQVLTPSDKGTERTVFKRDSATIRPDAIPATGQNVYTLVAPMSADETFADSVLNVVLAAGIQPSDAWFPQVMSYGCGACCIPPALCVKLSAPDTRIITFGFAESTGVTPCYFAWYHYAFMVVES